MYSLEKNYVEFESKSKLILITLDNLSAQPKTLERDIFIEGCFLKFVVYWENFFEDYFLSCMCKGKTKSGSILKPKANGFRRKEDAFKKLTPQRKSWDQEYLDWLDYSKVKERCLDYFHHKSRIHFVYSDATIINQVFAIRNHIAHNSRKSFKKFQDSVIATVGFLPVANPNVSDILISLNRRRAIRFYKIYINYYLDIADKLVI